MMLGIVPTVKGKDNLVLDEDLGEKRCHRTSSWCGCIFSESLQGPFPGLSEGKVISEPRETELTEASAVV